MMVLICGVSVGLAAKQNVLLIMVDGEPISV
jgi:hypothetical protein